MNFSCCLLSVLATALKGFLSGAEMQVNHYNVLQQVWLCPSCTHHAWVWQWEQEPHQVAENLCHQLRERGHAVGRSSLCTTGTGLLCLSGGINIHLLSETDLVYFFLGHSV